jgi:YaiO family outer membrane protein
VALEEKGVGGNEAKGIRYREDRRNKVTELKPRRLFTGAVILGVIAAATFFQPLHGAAQTAPPPWFAGVYYEREGFAGTSPIWTDWSAYRAVAVRRLDQLSLGVEIASVERFGLKDQTVAGEVYLNLWEGAYAHLRGRVTPEADLLPRADLRGEVFHTLGGGWEVSASIWRMNVAGPKVTSAGVGLASYRAQWLVRTQGSVARIGGDHALSGAVFARRYLGTSSREYLEFGGGTGEEIVVLGGGPVLDSRSTWFLSGSWQRFLHESLGVNLAAGVTDFEGVPLRRTLGVGLIARF